MRTSQILQSWIILMCALLLSACTASDDVDSTQTNDMDPGAEQQTPATLDPPKVTTSTAGCAFTDAGWISVTSTGAIANDAIDDTQAIQAAIDCLAKTGGTVLIPGGTYLIGRNDNGDSHLSVNSSGLNLVGVGNRTSKLIVHGKGPAIKGDCCESGGARRFDFGMSGINIIGNTTGKNKTPEPSVLVDLNDVDGALLHDVRIQNCTSAGIRVSGTSGSNGKSDLGATRNEFSSVFVGNCATGIEFGNLSNSARVIGGHFQNFNIGIDVSGGKKTANNISIIGAVIESRKPDAIGVRTNGVETAVFGSRIELPDPNSTAVRLIGTNTRAKLIGNYYSLSGEKVVSDDGQFLLLDDAIEPSALAIGETPEDVTPKLIVGKSNVFSTAGFNELLNVNDASDNVAFGLTINDGAQESPNRRRLLFRVTDPVTAPAVSSIVSTASSGVPDLELKTGNNAHQVYLSASTANVGIGQDNPAEKLDIKGGNLYLSDKDSGVILTAASGSDCFKLTVSNSGELRTNRVSCPAR